MAAVYNLAPRHNTFRIDSRGMLWLWELQTFDNSRNWISLGNINDPFTYWARDSHRVPIQKELYYINYSDSNGTPERIGPID